MEKKSFILYSDWIDLFSQLPDEKAGLLIKHIFNYVNKKNITTDDLLINIAFEPIKKSIERDMVKWEKIRSRNIENINKRWGTKNTTGKSGKKINTKNTVNVNVSGNVSDSVIVNETINKSQFEIALDAFIDHRKKLKKPLTPHGVDLLIKELIKLSDNEEERIQIINKSIVSGWQGVFALDKKEKREESIYEKWGIEP